jgi:hypothetical protein
MALSKSFLGHCKERGDEAISLLRHERDCFAALLRNFSLCHSERSEESPACMVEMLHSVQHDTVIGHAERSEEFPARSAFVTLSEAKSLLPAR